jgi:hypothetical protein
VSLQFKADPNVEKSLMKWGKEALSDLGYLEMDDLTAQVTAEFKERCVLGSCILMS